MVIKEEKFFLTNPKLSRMSCSFLLLERNYIDFFFPSSCHCLISLKSLSSITCFLYGESLFVDALCSCAVLRAPLKQEKLGYQWKSAEYYHFFLMFFSLFFEKFFLHAPSPLILLPPSILCLPPTKTSTTKTSLLPKTMVRHIKSLIFF